MKRNFRKLLSVVLSLVMVFTCLTSVGITAFAEGTTATDEVVVKKGPFDFTDATDFAYGNGATVENGKVKIDIKNANGAAWMRFPYEIVSGTEYSVRFKIKAVASGWMHLTLKTAYAQNNGVGFEHTNSAHIASRIEYPDTITKNEWTDIEYSFVANNPTEGDYKYLGLFIQTSVAAEIYIDNLQIAPAIATEVVPQSATFDFEDASDLEYAYGTYWSGGATVEDGKLNVSIPNNNYRVETRYPFVLQEGKKYRVRYELTTETAKSIGLYVAYAGSANGEDMILQSNSAYRSLIQNGSLAVGTHIIEYVFTANIPAAGYDKLGLLFWANNADVAFSIDNLEITQLDSTSAVFDFTKASDLQYAKDKYGSGSATVADGVLNLSLINNHPMKAKFPFVLQDGKQYKVKYDLTLSGAKSLLLGIAYAGPTNDYNMFSEGDRLEISNGSRAAGTHTVEYTFTASIPDTDYDQLGLLFWATAADATVTVDNLEISVVDTEKAYFDFSDSSDLQYGYVTYNAGGASVQENMLKVQINSANYRAKMKFPFALESGETYRVRFDIKADTAKQEMVYIAYAGSGTEENVIVHSTNKIDGGWLGLGNKFQTVEYTFTAACPEGNNQIGIFINAGSTAGNTIYIDNLYILKEYLAPDTPNAPDMASHTENSITLMDMRGYEYKIDDGEWQTSPVFENLVQGQTYSFYQRVAASDIYGATSASEAFEYFIANYGDADHSGEIDTADLVLIRKVLLGADEVYDEFAADIKDDGVINIIDLVKLKKALGEKKNQ